MLLISTDPAHSLADIFELRGSCSRPCRPPRKSGKLFVWQIDSAKEFDKFLKPYRQQLFEVLESGTIFSRAEIEPLLSAALPGVSEIAALIAISQALDAGSYEQIIVDTAPMGHTLRLFALPEQFLRFLDFLDLAASRDRMLAAHLTQGKFISHPFLREWRSMAQRVASALTPARGARIVLVTTPEKFSLNESFRAAQAMARDLPEVRVTDIVLNRACSPQPRQIAPDRSQINCRACEKTIKQTEIAKAFLRRNFRGVPVLFAGDSSGPILGASALAKFGAHIFAAKPMPQASPPPASIRVANLLEVEWPGLKVPLVLTLGKGGVGKTTVSAALAFHQRQANRRRKVMVASTDPAPSLDDVFQQQVEDDPVAVLGDAGLRAVEFDSVQQFQLWAAAMKGKIERTFSNHERGVHVDFSFDRQILMALLDIIPPGVDEIFAIFRVLDLLDSNPTQRAKKTPQLVVLDMAPTGHALELLRMPERLLLWARPTLKALAPHRSLPLVQDLAVEIAQLSQRVRSLRDILKDNRRCQAIPVMLPELLPDRETGRLLHALSEMGLHAPAIFVNRVLDEGIVEDCSHCRLRAHWQLATLARLQSKMPGKIVYVARDANHEITGRKGLQSFTRALWQLASRRRARIRS